MCQESLRAWQGMNAHEREREYSPSSCIGGNYQPFIAAYSVQSKAAKAALDSLFAATACVTHGLAFAAINYTLAPHANLDEIVQECRAALAFLSLHARPLGFDANNMVVSGTSAGAHLAAMVCMPQRDGASSHKPVKPKGAVLVSGVYDLEPLIGTSINQALGLDIAQAQRNSPLLWEPADFPPALVAWGDTETLEFKRQSMAFHAHLGQGGAPSDILEIPGRNHFDAIMDLADVNSPLFTKTLALFDTARA
jgi:arylformamidase